MKNIHILPTPNPSRLFINPLWEHQLRFVKDKLIEKNKERLPQNIYITNDEKIKKGDWCLNLKTNKVIKVGHHGHYGYSSEKIILTTDPELIKDGVQAIPDEFLEWFVKNPSCEEIEVISCNNYSISENKCCNIKYYLCDCGRIEESANILKYKITIPKEEPKQEYEYIGECKGNNDDGCFMNSSGHNCGCYTRKPIKQETLEEAAEREYPTIHEQYQYDAFIDGAKWMQERSYIEANKIIEFLDNEAKLKISDTKTIERIKWYFETYFEQFKKK